MKRHGHKSWAGEDDNTLMDFYEDNGGPYCALLMPHRSLGAIQQRAFKLGLSSNVNPAFPGQELYPMPADDREAWSALNNFRTAEPANDNFLRWAV